jgi:hypothetical protein
VGAGLSAAAGAGLSAAAGAGEMMGKGNDEEDDSMLGSTRIGRGRLHSNMGCWAGFGTCG